MAERKKPQSKIRKEIEQIHELNELASLKSTQSRARSATIGSATGGLIEIVMRGDVQTMWYVMNPVEAVEMLEQLASACGLEILKRPKQDFSAWRSWDLEQPNAVHWKGAAPWQINDKDRKQLLKIEEKKNHILPVSTDVMEPQKLIAPQKKKRNTKATQNNEE